jgi:hypothetical protein
MPVHQKINSLRQHIHSTPLKKTGHNKFSGYYYFELADFLVPALSKCFELDLCPMVSFTGDTATMTVTDLEDGSQVAITSPMSSASLKACHEVQNLGAVQTYLRRYLWVALLEIVEHDAIDSSHGAEKKKQGAEKAAQKQTDRQLTEREQELVAFSAFLVECHEAGRDLDAIKAWYLPANWSDDNPTEQEERTFVWGELKPWSKLRSTIKANKPEQA